MRTQFNNVNENVLINRGKRMAQMLKMLILKLTLEYWGLDFDYHFCTKIFPELFFYHMLSFGNAKRKELVSN